MTGGAGRLGRALQTVATQRGMPLSAKSRSELDVTNAAQIDAVFSHWRPEVVINAAARTAVDQCEAEPDLTYAVNADGAHAIALACSAIGAHCLHISTDYVFGDVGPPLHAEDAAPDPVNLYGRSKAKAETLVLDTTANGMVVRTAWLFGDTLDDFIGRLLHHGRGKEVIDVVHDQFGSPTPILGAAEGLLDIALMLSQGHTLPRILHLAGAPAVTRAEWAEETFAVVARYGLPAPRVRRILTEQFPTPARRPLRTALDVGLLKRLIGKAPDWRSATEASVLNRIDRVKDLRPPPPIGS